MIDMLRYIMNTSLWILRYPIGLLMLFLLPAIIMTYHQYYLYYWRWHDYTYYFMYGFATASMIWIIFFIGRPNFLKTLEHEIAHAIMGFLTFNPPREIDVQESGGGYMRYSGEANWVMALAPYYMPLTAFGMIVVAWFIHMATGQTPLWILSGIGVGCGYNLFANLGQIHPGQTDFRVAGRVFTAMFLPSMNLLVYGWILSFVNGGDVGRELFFNLIRHNILLYDNFF